MFSWLVDSILFGVATPFFWIFIWIPFLVIQALDFIFNFISFNLFNLIFFGKSNLDLNNFSFSNFRFNPIFLIFLLPIGLLIPFLGYRALKYQAQHPQSLAFKKFIRNLPKYIALVFFLPFGIYIMSIFLKFIVLLIKKSTNLNNNPLSDNLWDQIRFVEWNTNRGWDVNEWRELKNHSYWWDFKQWRTIHTGDSMSFLFRGWIIILIYLLLVLNFILGMGKVIWKLLLMLLLSPIYNIKLLFYDKNSKETKQYWNDIKGLILSYLFCLIGYSFISFLINFALEKAHSINIFANQAIVGWIGEMLLTAVLCFTLTITFSKLLQKLPEFFGFASSLDLSTGTRIISKIIPKKSTPQVQQNINKFSSSQNSNNVEYSNQSNNINPLSIKSSYKPLNFSQIKDFEKQSPIFIIPASNSQTQNTHKEINIKVDVSTNSETSKNSK
ncbi:hypothetical protein NPA08_00185 [Mycoplasmopsis citelli]|uniref:Mbov_0396 family ICE element transmembrane protein n=1 Tax=Mycoplasmopsis citelli TaxID=171281 RepID=UPI002114E967|nr:hypothetical protein [Mycoplasmopsis citelli]UUD36248.1 hypothetical protein NPA08_00185 [Mycoplasmopsis citelli]